MKTNKIKVFFVLALLPLSGFSQSGDFVIEGKVHPKHHGRFVKLYYISGKSKIADSAAIQKGAFKLTGQLASPTMGKLSLGNEKTGDQIDFLLAPGTIQVQAKDSIRNASVNGPKITADYEKIAKKLRPADYRMYDQFAIYLAMPEAEAKKAYLAELMTGLGAYNSNKKSVVHQFVAENPTSYVSLYLLDRTSPGALLNYETTYPHYAKLSPELRASPLGKAFETRLLAVKGSFTGTSFKDFVSTTPEGKSLSLKEVISKHKYTLVDFWASWCGPCRKENPNVVKAYTAFKDKGFTVLSVSLDDKADKWNEAIKKDGMPWYHVSSLKGWKEPAAELYGIRAIPQNILIDAKGNIVAANLKEETLYTKIEELTK